MTEENRKRAEPGDSFREGVRAVTGILGALRDAIEQTFDDMTDRGDISQDKAKDAAKDTMNRAQEAMDKVRDRLDFATRKELEELRAEVAELKRRLNVHQAGGHTGDPMPNRPPSDDTPGHGPQGGFTGGIPPL